MNPILVKTTKGNSHDGAWYRTC